MAGADTHAHEADAHHGDNDHGDHHDDHGDHDAHHDEPLGTQFTPEEPHPDPSFLGVVPVLIVLASIVAGVTIALVGLANEFG